MIRLLRWFWYLLFPRPNTIVREDGFYRRIAPMVNVSNDELDRVVPTDRPVRVVDHESGNAAISIPFGVLPVNVYIRGPRYRVMYDRMVTPQFNGEDVTEIGKKKPISIPFATYPRQERDYRGIVTPRFRADIGELRTWEMDIRGILSDNSILDMLSEEDDELTDAATQ